MPLLKAAVIGGGPAGLSAALGLLRAGFDTTVYEQRENWTGRVCGAFLNPEAVRHLKWLGVLEKAQTRNVAPVSSSRLFDDKGRSIELPIEQDGINGLALSRKELEEILLETVKERGGNVQFGSRIKDPASIKADVTVMAAGRFAPPNLPTEQRGEEHGWYGWNATFSGVPQRPGELSMHFYPGGYVGVITFADGSSNVCGLFKRKGKRPVNWEKTHAQAQAHAPSLKNLLLDAVQISEWHGVGPLPFSLSMRDGRGALLAGDAAAVGDPYMGEGLGRALSAGPMLFRTWTETNGENFTARYQKLWQNHYALRLRFGHVVRALLGFSPLFHVVMRLAFGSRGSLVRALPVFHRGFDGSHVSYS